MTLKKKHFPEHKRKTSEKSYERPSWIRPFAAMAIVDRPYLHLSLTSEFLNACIETRIPGESQSQTLNILGHLISGRCESDTTWSSDTYLIFRMAAHGESRLQNASFNTHRRHMCDSKTWCVTFLQETDGSLMHSTSQGRRILCVLQVWDGFAAPYEVLTVRSFRGWRDDNAVKEDLSWVLW